MSHAKRRTRLYKILMLLIVSAAQFFAYAYALQGSPTIKRFPIAAPHLPESFTVAQADDGLIYLGTSEGLLSFDGEHWRALQLPQQSMVRSLKSVGRRVYVGGYSTFGYAEPNAMGQLIYTDLSARIQVQPAQFADIWEINVFADGVYFRSLRRLFYFQFATQKIDSWYHEGRFAALNPLNGKPCIQFRGVGFKVRTAQGWQLLPHSAFLSERAVSLPHGNKLVVANNLGYFSVTESAVEKLVPASNVPNFSAVHRMAQLSEQQLGIVGADGMLTISDFTLTKAQSFNVNDGFLSDLLRTSDGLLVVSTSAPHRVDWPNMISNIAENGGLRSNMLGLRMRGDELLVATHFDALRAGLASNGSTQLERQNLLQGSVDDAIFLPDGSQLVMSENNLSHIAGGKNTVLQRDVYGREFFQDAFIPTRWWLRTENGIARVEWRAGKIHYVADVIESAVLISSLVQLSASELMAGTDGNGLRRYAIAADGRLSVPQILHANAAPALRVPLAIDATTYLTLDAEQRILVSSAEQVLRLQDGKWQLDPRFGPLFTMKKPQWAAKLTFATRQNRIYAHTADQLFVLPWSVLPWSNKQSELDCRAACAGFVPQAERVWRELKIADVRESGVYVDVLEYDAQTLLVLTENRLLQLDLRQENSALPSAQLNFTSVWRIDALGNSSPLAIAPSATVVLDPSDLGVRFEFALTGLKHAGQTQYRGRLQGYEVNNSEFASTAGYTYTRLQPGDYSMSIEARDLLGHVYRAPNYPVRFSPKWHQRSATRWLLALTMLALLATMTRKWVRWRTSRLQTMIEQQTHALAEANQRLQQTANLDALTGLPNRRKLDEFLNATWRESEHKQRSIALLVIDADHFKVYNDTYGHVAGDVLLQALANNLNGALHRAEDLLARYGGEEFVAVLPGTVLADALLVAERLRASVAGATLGVTVSIGVAATLPKTAQGARALTEAADAALYRAKQQGRNSVSQ